MATPTDLAERLRRYPETRKKAWDLYGKGYCYDDEVYIGGTASQPIAELVIEAADALDRLSSLESAASQREKNAAYVAFCIKSALDNGEKPVQDVTLENWRDYLEGRANAPGPDETWSDVAQPDCRDRLYDLLLNPPPPSKALVTLLMASEGGIGRRISAFVDALFALRHPGPLRGYSFDGEAAREKLDETLSDLMDFVIESAASGAVTERRVVCPSCGVAFDRSSKWARDASAEPAPSDGASPPGLTTPTFVESGAYMARDDAKKGKVSDG